MHQPPVFPTQYKTICTLLGQIDPEEYAKTRNYFDGTVSHLSPYISRGVLPLKEIKDWVASTGSPGRWTRFVSELAWREYFQLNWWRLGYGIFSDVWKNQEGVQHRLLVKNIVEGKTGIHAFDEHITQLYQTGYMHNRARLYTASLTCNIAKAHWLRSSRWMYYHLLDGDLASNALSWQWVCGTYSQKKYYFNQENVNKFSHAAQHGTFLDLSYEDLVALSVPEVLQEKTKIELTTSLPSFPPVSLDASKPLLLYNSYNLDPRWRSDMDANRVLLLEPSHFAMFPVSRKVIDFIIDLSQNIPAMQIFAGEVDRLPGITGFQHIYSKNHPAFSYYPGMKDPLLRMFPEADASRSFSHFWKDCLKSMTP